MNSSELTHLERQALDVIRAGGSYEDIALKLAHSNAYARALVSSAAKKTGAKTWDDLKAAGA